jgi:hypothetical protein
LTDQAADIYCHNIARIDRLGSQRRATFTLPSIDSHAMDRDIGSLIVGYASTRPKMRAYRGQLYEANIEIDGDQSYA